MMKFNISRRGRERFLPRFILASAAALAIALFPGGGIASAQATAAKQPAKSASKKPAKSSKKKPAARSSRARGQAAPAADRIREIQAALARAGHYSSEPNGKWDANTTAAMRKFQEAQGLRSTGKLDAVSLQKLGLGSPIAGIAPPRTISASSTSNK